MSVFLLECCWQHYFFCLFWEKKSWVAIRIFDVWLINKYLKSCKTMIWNWFLLYGTAVCILSLDPGNLNLCEVNDIWSSFLYTFLWWELGCFLKLHCFLYGIDLCSVPLFLYMMALNFPMRRVEYLLAEESLHLISRFHGTKYILAVVSVVMMKFFYIEFPFTFCELDI